MTEITLIRPDGSEEKVEIPDELWERFENRAKELGVPVDELFKIAVDTFLRDKGY